MITKPEDLKGILDFNYKFNTQFVKPYENQAVEFFFKKSIPDYEKCINKNGVDIKLFNNKRDSIYYKLNASWYHIKNMIFWEKEAIRYIEKNYPSVNEHAFKFGQFLLPQYEYESFIFQASASINTICELVAIFYKRPNLDKIKKLEKVVRANDRKHNDERDKKILKLIKDAYTEPLSEFIHIDTKKPIRDEIAHKRGFSSIALGISTFNNKKVVYLTRDWEKNSKKKGESIVLIAQQQFESILKFGFGLFNVILDLNINTEEIENIIKNYAQKEGRGRGLETLF